MKNLELYSGLITGGLGTGYNLIQGDSLPSALAQGAILGTAIGGGMYGANKLLNNVKVFKDIEGNPVALDSFIYDYLYPHKRLSIDYRPYDEAIDEIATDIKKQTDNRGYNYEYQDIKDNIENTFAMDDYYYMKEAVDKHEKNIDNIYNKLPAIASGVGAGTGFITGAVINDIFQDKSEREQAQLLSELELLKANGSISPYLDDYLMRNS